MTRSHNSRRGKSASLKGTVEKGPHRQKAIKEHNHRRNRAERRGVLAQDPRDLLLCSSAPAQRGAVAQSLASGSDNSCLVRRAVKPIEKSRILQRRMVLALALLALCLATADAG
jgi:hypothetical protein